MKKNGPLTDKPLMELRYPRSFLALLLVGFGIVALPLIAGLVSNAISIERLSEQSQLAVFNATVATQSARQLSTAEMAMERSARSYAISGDRDSIDAYENSRAGFRKLLADFIVQPLEPEMKTAATVLQQKEANIYALVVGKPPSEEMSKQVERDFAELANRTQAINTLANRLIDLEVVALKSFAAKSRNQVIWQLLAMIPSALLMIAGFTYLLARPIRDLGRAIHRLGEGKLAKRIRVSGPHDIEMLGEKLDWLRQRLIALEDQKTRFFQHVSHELKTPLTALREGSELLCDEVVGKLTDEQREVAEILKQNSLTLEKLIQDLLTYSQAQSSDRLGKKTAFEIKSLQLRDLIDQVINAQRLAIVAKSITVKRECEKIPFHGDAEKLRVVIDNLLSNAIKYSPVSGTIVLRLGKHKEHAVFIDVIDSGPGIAPEDRDRIFDPFYRGKHAAASAVKGTGLGLAIARDYVELHQGSVKAIDAAGAHFRVILPKQSAAI
ncbi:MAG: HAMP domain-containing sensor histidine kinase [Betaproteobacteria bacterium]